MSKKHKFKVGDIVDDIRSDCKGDVGIILELLPDNCASINWIHKGAEWDKSSEKLLFMKLNDTYKNEKEIKRLLGVKNEN